MRVSTKMMTSCFLPLSVVYALPVLAQSTPAAEGGAHEETSGQLSEIVVTAQKTTTSLQRTPIAITAISGEGLGRADIRSVVDLDKQVPSLAIQSSGVLPLNVTIRGVGYEGIQNNSAQAGVAVVENGVYIASPFNLSTSFLDLAQLEVLRGPQGTVNGQNADGGAINITTGMPQLDGFHVDGEASYGSYNYDRLRGVANAPFGETFAIRVAAQHEGHGGWLRAPFQPVHKHVGDDDSWTGRLSALWKPTDRFSITLWGEYFDKDIDGVGVRNVSDPISDPRATSNDYPTPSNTLSRIAAATVAYDFDFAVLKSISSYQNTRLAGASTSDLIDRASAIATYGFKEEIPDYYRKLESYTQEINLAHNGGRLDWIVGGFFLRSNGSERLFLVRQSTPVRIPYTVNYNPTPAEAGLLFFQGLSFVSTSTSRRTSVAGYGQATFHVTDALRVTGGARGSWDKYTSQTSNFFAAPVPLESKFTKLTGKAVVEYDVVPTSTVYASYSTGVKPGGNNLNLSAIVVPKSFKHEFVRAYEIGSKNEFFDRKVRLNLSAFYNDYRRLQAQSQDIDPYGGGLTNIPKAEIYGLEGELSAILPAGFRIDANAAFLRSKINSHFQMLDPVDSAAADREAGGFYVGDDLALRAAAFRDVYGNELPRVPHFSGSAGISKHVNLGDTGSLDLFVQGNYRSRFWARVYNKPLDRVGTQFFANFNMRYEPAAGPWYVEFQVTNVTKSDDVASRFPDPFSLGTVYDTIVPPRQFIGRVGVSF